MWCASSVPVARAHTSAATLNWWLRNQKTLPHIFHWKRKLELAIWECVILIGLEFAWETFYSSNAELTSVTALHYRVVVRLNANCTSTQSPQRDHEKQKFGITILKRDLKKTALMDLVIYFTITLTDKYRLVLANNFKKQHRFVS